jgi:hypothetical protein
MRCIGARGGRAYGRKRKIATTPRPFRYILENTLNKDGAAGQISLASQRH